MCEENEDISSEKQYSTQTGKAPAEEGVKKIPICERPIGRIMRIISILYMIFVIVFMISTRYIFPESMDFIDKFFRNIIGVSILIPFTLYLFVFQKEAIEYRFKWLHAWGKNPVIIILKLIGMLLYVFIMGKILFNR